MRRSRDKRLPTATIVLVAILLSGVVLRHWVVDMPQQAGERTPLRESVEPAVPLDERFRMAVGMLHTRHFIPAAQAFSEVVELAPWMPEAEVNLGYALLGMGEPNTAQAHFERALSLNENQLNAYYGLAVARERQGDLDSALGAMRVYVHLAGEDDAHAPKAWAAIWEWEAARRERQRDDE